LDRCDKILNQPTKQDPGEKTTFIQIEQEASAMNIQSTSPQIMKNKSKIKPAAPRNPTRAVRRQFIGGTLILTFSLTTIVAEAASPQSPATEYPRDPAAGELRRSGTIQLDITSIPEVKNDFYTALALLHSFFYDEARRRFEDIAKRDPECAMAWWGVAMTWHHPLWAPPTVAERANGLAAVQKANAIKGKSELERGLIEAIESFYITNELPAVDAGAGTIAGCSCCGPQAHSARAHAFHSSFEELHERFPDNVEVASFYTLAKLGTAIPSDKTHAQQRIAGALLEPLFESNPNHPGIAHYLIHAYDYPELAAGALDASRQYDDIAPWVPHALHMPTHIYTRMGMWEDSIKGNIASSKAARDYARRFYEGATTMDDLHAMDYLTFAYLQTARDAEAQKVLEHLQSIQTIVPGNEFASAYALTAIPARYALERGRWTEAASLELPLPDFVSRFPFAVAHIEFAHAVGAARSGNLEAAEQAVQRLVELRDSVTDPKFQWWIGQVDIQRLAATAWLEHAGGKAVKAEELFREAAGIEDRAGTHPVTPGQVLPAREQLGEFLLETGKPAAALVEFERSLQAFPRRFRSHRGAAEAAELIGQQETARLHAGKLVEMAGETGERIAELETARRILTASAPSRK
jgi:tetratricopeptide (TPR) repeat protein